MRQRWLASLLVLLALLSGCAGEQAGDAKQELVVLAGVSLTAPFQAIERDFERSHGDVDSQVNLSTGRAHLEQLRNGLRADVLAVAYDQDMIAAIQAGQVETGVERVFATNSLVVVLPHANPAGIQRLADLGRQSVRLVFGAKET